MSANRRNATPLTIFGAGLMFILYWIAMMSCAMTCLAIALAIAVGA